MSRTRVYRKVGGSFCVCAPARTGCMECLRRAALLRPHIRACHFALVLLEVALRHFPCLSIAEAHMHCLPREPKFTAEKKRWISLRRLFRGSDVEMMKFCVRVVCVNYSRRAVGPLRVVWGPGGGRETQYRRFESEKCRSFCE
jgi:hypothetical protein